MITKNEADTLESAIKSVSAVADQVVVMDTGSTDGTQDIAKKAGAEVYITKWEFDFSKARNVSISRALHDWIFILDGDEQVAATPSELKKILLEAPLTTSAFECSIVNKLKHGDTRITQPRLFRNRAPFRYERPVHNIPVVPPTIAKMHDLVIEHNGYNLTPERMQEKHNRRVDMITKWIEREPNNYQAHSYMANTLVNTTTQHGLEGCIFHARKALFLAQQARVNDAAFAHPYYSLIVALAKLKRYDEAVDSCLECIELVPFYSDPYYHLFKISKIQEKVGEAKKYADVYLKLQAAGIAAGNFYRQFENMTAMFVPGVEDFLKSEAKEARSKAAKETLSSVKKLKGDLQTVKKSAK